MGIIFNFFGCTMFIIDLVLDLVLVHTYWHKEECTPNHSTALSEGKIFNSTHPRNELEIELNYHLYAVICLVLSLVPTYIQSLCRKVS